MKTNKDLDLDYSFNKIAGQVIREHRERQQLSLSQLAEKVKTTKQNIYKYEVNKSRIKVSMFNSICYALNEDPSKVFEEIQKRFNNSYKDN